VSERDQKAAPKDKPRQPGRYVCIHGHFYQPPRENAWLEGVEIQDSAYPFHDWNERITAECYGPNGASRLLNGDGRIRAITNNYAHMSFNFGPTLLSWLKDASPDVYTRVLDADTESQRLFRGHGSALAQGYNHLILPLANSRDKRTQIVWGLRDFELRFGRKAEGMWLPETAVDMESLGMMAELGLKFTILSPHQAQRVRILGQAEGEWQDVKDGHIDPTRAYQCTVSSARSIAIFFYDGPISQAAAFDGLLSSGENLEGRLRGAFSDDRDWAQLVHIATDGETYGHHSQHGDMALAYVLESIPKQSSILLTNYGSFLEAHPPEMEVEIKENTSWSCVHGVERWRSDCGCNTGTHPGWNQAWRGPLREALDWLRDSIVPLYETEAGRYFTDPWAARDGYIEVIFDRHPEIIEAFMQLQAGRTVSGDELLRVLSLLELQRHTMLMYTSCGWFFDELSGIETVQVMQYAGRALQLARHVLGADFEAEFLARLERVKSNLPEQRDGRHVYDTLVRPAAIDLVDVGAHFAISSVFEEYEGRTRIYSFEVERTEEETMDLGAMRLRMGKVTVNSVITLQSADLSYAVLDLGDPNLKCKIRPFDEKEHEAVVERARNAFTTADFGETARILDEVYGGSSYDLRSAFRDEQRKLLGFIVKAGLDEAEDMFRLIYEKHAPLILFLSSLGIPRPRAFEFTAELVLNDDLQQALEEDHVKADRIEWLLSVIGQTRVMLDGPRLGLAFQSNLERTMHEFRVAGERADGAGPEDTQILARLATAAAVVRKLPFEVDLWAVQNDYCDVLRRRLDEMREKAAAGDTGAQTWVYDFLALGESLWVKID